MKKSLLLIVGLILFGTLAGCSVLGFKADQFSANTTASANKEGFSYSSNKNQENLSADGEFDPATGKTKFTVKTTASTPEAAIAAALQANAMAITAFSEIMKVVIPLAKAAATKGAPIP